MTTEEIMNELRSESPLNKARAIFSGYSGKIEQQSSQGLGPIEMRGLEFETVRKIWELKP